jgi:hypothetical protein
LPAGPAGPGTTTVSAGTFTTTGVLSQAVKVSAIANAAINIELFIFNPL